MRSDPRAKRARETQTKALVVGWPHQVAPLCWKPWNSSSVSLLPRLEICSTLPEPCLCLKVNVVFLQQWPRQNFHRLQVQQWPTSLCWCLVRGSQGSKSPVTCSHLEQLSPLTEKTFCNFEPKMTQIIQKIEHLLSPEASNSLFSRLGSDASKKSCGVRGENICLFKVSTSCQMNRSCSPTEESAQSHQLS